MEGLTLPSSPRDIPTVRWMSRAGEVTIQAEFRALGWDDPDGGADTDVSIS